jgi:hypothetical protein
MATFINQSNAQAPLRIGGNQLNVGVGISGWGVPVYIGFDHGFKRDITLGAEFSFRSYRNDYNKNRYRHSIYGFSVNGNYHFSSVLDIPKNWDFYAGLNLGYYAWQSPSDYRGEGNSGIGLGLQVGGRYFFDKNFGVNLELGGATVAAGGKFGITYLF